MATQHTVSILGVARNLFRHPKRTITEIAAKYGPRRTRFGQINRANVWGGDESRSGPGSSLSETAAIREALPGLLREIGATSFLDIPCGDFHWMKEVDLPVQRYIGADIVDGVVKANRKRYADDVREFVRLDLLRSELPKVDVVMCRDVLDHLSFEDAHTALANIKRSGATYLLATTYPTRDNADDIRTGQWRPLNLERAPFGLPAPMHLIDERSQKPGYPDKSLGLWRTADL